MAGVSRTRRVLVLLVLLGSLGNLGAATTASFTASTTNPAANFATGALVLSNDVGSEGSTVCMSTNGVDTDVNEGDCDQLFPVAVNKPGDTVSVLLDIGNVGNLAGNLSVFADAVCVSAADTAVPYNGSGDLCQGVQLNIQQYTTDVRDVEDSCVYGGGTATVCAFDTWGTATEKTLAHFTATNTPAAKLSMGSLAAGATRFLTIELKMDQSLDNTFQGLKASWTITWYLEQLA